MYSDPIQISHIFRRHLHKPINIERKNRAYLKGHSLFQNGKITTLFVYTEKPYLQSILEQIEI